MKKSKNSSDDALRRAIEYLERGMMEKAVPTVLGQEGLLRDRGEHFDAGLLGLEFSTVCLRNQSLGSARVFADMAIGDFEKARAEGSGSRQSRACQLNIAECHSNLGACYHARGEELPKAISAFEKATEIFRACGEEAAACKAEVSRAFCVRDYGEETSERRLVEESVASLKLLQPKLKALGDIEGAVQCYCSMNSALIMLGRPDEVLGSRDQALALCHRGGRGFQLEELMEQYEMCRLHKDELMKLQRWGE
jgi:tetratricopeptide (TPR) repeat protein